MSFRAIVAACAAAATPACAQVVGVHCLAPASSTLDFGRYTVMPDGSQGGIQTLSLPKASDVFLLPAKQVVCPATQGAWTLQPDGTFLVNQTGLYRMSMSIDHPAQGGAKRGSSNPNGFDIDMRSLSIGMLPAGTPLTGVRVGDGLDIQKTVYTRLAAQNIPGSDSPAVVRASIAFGGATVDPTLGAYIDVSLPETGIIVPGDTVTASLTSLTDAIGVAANNAITVTARVLAPDRVRVFVDNVRGGVPVAIPAGVLNVMAVSQTKSRGQSFDGWTVLNTPTVLLMKGETVFFGWGSEVPGDFLQFTFMTWMQLEYLGPAASGGTAKGA
jgi:hypothetical protein